MKRVTSEYVVLRKKNPQYSLRAFARRLGIQVSALSEIMNNKRNITKKMASRILDGLCVGPLERDKLLADKQTNKILDISLDYFKVISDWHYFAILSLAEIPEFTIDHEWISKRLNIPIREVKIAVERLIKLKMLVLNSKGVYIPSNVSYRTPTDIANISLKKHTAQSLELAKESLFTDSVEKRDFSTVTMAIDTKNLEKAKKLIRKFRRKLSEELECGCKKEVYKLAIQLFPLSKEVE